MENIGLTKPPSPEIDIQKLTILTKILHLTGNVSTKNNSMKYNTFDILCLHTFVRQEMKRV